MSQDGTTRNPESTQVAPAAFGGWVDRRQDPEHAKRFQISITEEGREKLKSVDRFFRAHAGESFDPFPCFTKAEKQELEKLLSKLNQHLSILRN